MARFCCIPGSLYRGQHMTRRVTKDTLDFFNNADEEVPQIETSFLCCECLTDQTAIAFQKLHFRNYLLMYKEEDPKRIQVSYKEFEQLQCPDVSRHVY